MSLKNELSKIAHDVEIVLNEMVADDEYENSPVDASRYAILDAGKRLRSFLTVQIGNLFNVPYDSSIRAGACIEFIHNFSLIHDDLPCIDNDSLRRGRPSVWAKYGERNAVLSGDFLLNHAYIILATDSRIITDLDTRIKLIKTLGEMTEGMIQGEWMDCEAELGKFQTKKEIDKIQNLKTGCLFNACTSFGAILGNANLEQMAALKKFTDAMGLCFQITDDILDVVGDQEKVGKTLHKDDVAGKATYVSLLGLDGASAKARELVEQAKNALRIFDERADNLRELMDYMINRES